MNFLWHQQAHLFTFVTSSEEDTSDRSLPGRLACRNNAALTIIENNTDIFQQMAPYFDFIEESSGARQAVWTSPYVDDSGLGLMMTVAVPVYSNISGE